MRPRSHSPGCCTRPLRPSCLNAGADQPCSSSASECRMPPEISVIIPAYNREVTIGRAIGSVLAQSMQDFEIIVIDDGSKDSTLAVANGFCDDRIRISTHDRNRGAAAARNTGIGAARG